MIASIKRGDIYYAELSPVVGSEQGGMRPVLIIQNDTGNRYSPTVIAAAITSRMGKTRLPTHIDLYAERAGLTRDSIVLLEQVRTLDKRRLRERLGHLDEGLMREIDNAIAVSLGLIPHGTRLPEPVPVPRATAPAAVANAPAASANAPAAVAAAGAGGSAPGLPAAPATAGTAAEMQVPPAVASVAAFAGAPASPAATVEGESAASGAGTRGVGTN